MRHKIVFRMASVLSILFPLLLLREALADTGLCCIGILFLIHCLRQKEWHWLKEPWVRMLLLLWIFMMGRGIFSAQPYEALVRSLLFVRYIVFAAALARWTLADTSTRKYFFNVLTGFVIFCAVDGLLQYVIGIDIFHHRLIHDPNNGHIRLDGLFNKPILGIMLAWLAFPALLPLVLHTMLVKKSCKLLFYNFFVCILVITTIAFSGERMALLLTLCGMVMAGFLFNIKLRRWVMLGATTGVLLTTLAVANPDMFQRQVTSTANTLGNFSNSPYGLLLQSDLALAAKHPLLGVGADGFRAGCETLYANDAARITSMCNTHPHNIYLEWLVEEGLVGFLLFAGFILCVVKDCAANTTTWRDNPCFIGLLVAFTLRAWPFMSATSFYSRWGAPPFWLVLGALLVYTARKEDNDAGTALAFQDARF